MAEKAFTDRFVQQSRSSSQDPIKIQLPKTIEEYKQKELGETKARIVTTTFKVVDCAGKVVSNFPIQSRPRGRKNAYERYTNENGIVEVLSSPQRDIEILVLTSNDQFVVKCEVNSKNGSQQPILIQLDEPYSNFKSRSELKLKDRTGEQLIETPTDIEMLMLDTGKKQIITILNGSTPLFSMVGQRLQFRVLKPNGDALSPVTYIAKRMRADAVELRLDVEIVKGITAEGRPSIEKQVVESECVCNRDITLEEFKKITRSKTALSFLKDLNEQFAKFNMHNCLEKAHFIAHTLHETASYSLLEEVLVGKTESQVYDGYKGRGLMQLTYKNNYMQYGLAVNENFLGENKHKISKEKEHAVGSAIWYWFHSKSGNLTPHALKNDLIATCALINGGYNGFDDREKYYKKSASAFNIKKCLKIDKTIVRNLDNYTDFENSYIFFNKPGECFGWGLWNDPKMNKKGKVKNEKEARKGYQQFLNMSKDVEFPFGFTLDKNKNKISRKRYGYTANAAKKIANTRLKEI
ncbi:hypothetical protein HXZ67_10855 [Acinetobacter towneri]|nr:hypothetical protein [Acinetobacter towneri]